MDFGIVAGDTDQTIYVRLRDSTTGLAKTGLAYNSAGAVASYTLPGAARAAITLATQTASGAHSDGGFVEVDATNCKGLYRLDLPDAAIASGKYSIISIEFDGIIEESIIVPLTLRKSDVRQLAGVTQSLTDLKDFADDGYDPSTNKVQGVVLTDTVTTYTGNTVQTGDAYAIVNSGTHGNAALKTLIDAVDNFVDTEITDISNRLPAALGANGNMMADIRDVVGTACSLTVGGVLEVDITHIGGAALDTTAAQIGVNVVKFGDTAGTFSGRRPEVNTTHAAGTAWGSGAITAAAFANNAITSSAIAVSAVTSIQNGLLTSLSFFDGIVPLLNYGGWGSTIGDTGNSTTTVHLPTLTHADDDLNGYTLWIRDASTGLRYYRKITDWVNATALATVDTLPFTPQNDTDEFAIMPPWYTATGFSTHTAAAVADAVWEEAIADHSGTSGSTAEQLAAAGAAGDPWATALPGAYSSGQAGKIVGDNLNATVSSRSSHTAANVRTEMDSNSTQLAAIVADTNELQTDWANGGRLDLLLDGRATPAQVATELATYDGPTNAEMVARTLAAASYATATAQTTAQADLDILTGTDGVTLATSQPNYAPSTAAALASLVTTVGAAGAGLTEAGGDGDHLTAINLPNQTMDITGNLSGSVGSVTGAVGSVTGNVGGSVGSVTGGINTAAGTITTLDALDTAQDTQHGTTQTAIGDVPTNAELATAIITGLTTALAEGYRGTGATGSVRDLLYELIAHLGNSGITSVTKTLKKLDGSTTAKTFTLDDDTTPTAIEETT